MAIRGTEEYVAFGERALIELVRAEAVGTPLALDTKVVLTYESLVWLRTDRSPPEP